MDEEETTEKAALFSPERERDEPHPSLSPPQFPLSHLKFVGPWYWTRKVPGGVEAEYFDPEGAETYLLTD